MVDVSRDDRLYALWAVVVPGAIAAGGVLAFATVSESTWTALISAGPPTIAALFAGILGWLNHKQGSKIHVLVNSNMSAVKSDLALANDRIEKLQDLVRTLTDPREVSGDAVKNLLTTRRNVTLTKGSPT